MCSPSHAQTNSTSLAPPACENMCMGSCFMWALGKGLPAPFYLIPNKPRLVRIFFSTTYPSTARRLLGVRLRQGPLRSLLKVCGAPWAQLGTNFAHLGAGVAPTWAILSPTSAIVGHFGH